MSSNTFSIIIISYKRDDVLKQNISLLEVLLRERSCEVILVDNNEDDVSRESYVTGFERGRYVKNHKNLGVSGGRNAGILCATGKFLIFLDDDAFVDTEILFDELEAKFNREPSLGAIAFRSINFYSQRIDRKEFPHTNKRLDPNIEFYTFRFIGVGHAIRREVFEECGLYIEDYFYGGEEFEFSYRMIMRNWTIQYCPQFRVVHKKSNSGRLPAVSACERRFVNQLKTNYLHLPVHIAILNTLAWSIKTLIDTRGKANWLKICNELFLWRKQSDHERSPLNKKSLQYIRKCGGQLWK